MDVPVKIILTWDIAAEHEQEYFEFVLGDFVPGVQRLGLLPSDAWATMFGDYPQIQVGMISPSLEQAQQAINSDGWRTLQDKLYNFVHNYTCKVIPARGGFQF